MTRERDYTVEAYGPDLGWSIWTAWVDRATAEDEKANAEELGYRARVRLARVVEREHGAL